MVNISEVSITFNGREEVYAIGKNKVKNIKFDEKSGLIKICFDNSLGMKYLSIPIYLLDSYNYTWFKNLFTQNVQIIFFLYQ